MILRGRIIADCIVSPGASTGHPVGTCAPRRPTRSRRKLTQIWGNNDIDTFTVR